jgi:hypothetical protein
MEPTVYVDLVDRGTGSPIVRCSFEAVSFMAASVDPLTETVTVELLPSEDKRALRSPLYGFFRAMEECLSILCHRLGGEPGTSPSQRALWNAVGPDSRVVVAHDVEREQLYAQGYTKVRWTTGNELEQELVCIVLQEHGTEAMDVEFWPQASGAATVIRFDLLLDMLHWCRGRLLH